MRDLEPDILEIGTRELIRIRGGKRSVQECGINSAYSGSPAGPVRIYRPGKPSVIVPADFSEKTVGDSRYVGLRSRRGHPLIER